MPFFRGIEASIGTQSDVGRLPEYPHPDDSSYQICDTNGASQDGQPNPHEDDNHVAFEEKPTRLPISNPMMSVYVPSLPGSIPSLVPKANLCPLTLQQARNSGLTTLSSETHSQMATSSSSFI